MKSVESRKVEIAAIHDIERAGFPDQLVEDVNVMHTASGDNNNSGKVALEGQQRVPFDGRLVSAERSPRKQREAEVNGGGVQSVSCGLEFKAERFIRVERGGLLDEDLGEDGATFVHKVKNRRLAVKHPRGVGAELKSKNDQTARICRFYRNEIAVS